MKRKEKKNGGNGRQVLAIETHLAVQAMVADEANFLADPVAGPDLIRLIQGSLPRFSPRILREKAGKVAGGLSSKDICRYKFPDRRSLERLVREQRDELIMSHSRIGRVRNNKSGKFVPTADFELQIKVRNRVLEMLRLRA